jgi:hypothetical protein
VGGAVGIVDDLLPEVAAFKTAWYLDAPYHHSGELAEKKKKEIVDVLNNPPERLGIIHSNLAWPRYKYWAAPQKGTLPALEKNGFIRDFGGELIAVKRPGYYTALYLGKPAPSRDSLRRTRERQGCGPYLGGGMSLFWTPDFGNCILGANWSPLTHHGLVAVDAAGKQHWEDYFATEYELDRGSNELVVKGAIDGQPVSYSRQYVFRDHEVQINLALHIEEDCGFGKLTENIPVLTGLGTSASVLVKKGYAPKCKIAAEGDSAGRARLISIRAENRSGVDIALGSPVEVNVLSAFTKYRRGQLGRVEILFPEEFKARDRVEISYVLRPRSGP